MSSISPHCFSIYGGRLWEVGSGTFNLTSWYMLRDSILSSTHHSAGVPNKLLFVGSMILLSVTLLSAGMLHFISSTAAYKFLALAVTMTIGISSGVVEVTGFFTLTSLFPHQISFATAIGELSINMAMAIGPYLGSHLYTKFGFLFAFIIPGVVVLLSIFAASRVPQVTNICRKRDISIKDLFQAVVNPWILFPAWHCAACQTLFHFPTPLLSLYVEEQFGKGVVWSGSIMFAATACLGLAAPIWGRIIDRFSPFPIMIFSCFSIPLVYIFVGPCPPMEPSRAQLFLALCIFGIILPSGCLPALSAMREAYRIQHKKGRNLSPQVSSCLVAVYCASHPLGGFLGYTSSGFLAKYLTFPQATSLLAGLFLLETGACVIYIVAFKGLKKRAAPSPTRGVPERGEGGGGVKVAPVGGGGVKMVKVAPAGGGVIPEREEGKIPAADKMRVVAVLAAVCLLGVSTEITCNKCIEATGTGMQSVINTFGTQANALTTVLVCSACNTERNENGSGQCSDSLVACDAQNREETCSQHDKCFSSEASVTYDSTIYTVTSRGCYDSKKKNTANGWMCSNLKTSLAVSNAEVTECTDKFCEEDGCDRLPPPRYQECVAHSFGVCQSIGLTLFSLANTLYCAVAASTIPRVCCSFIWGVSEHWPDPILPCEYFILCNIVAKSMMKSSLVILLVLLGSSQAIMCNGCVEARSKTVTADGEATTTTNAKKGCAAAPVSGAASTDTTFALAGDDTTYAIISDTWCSTNMCMDYSPRLSCLKCSATVKDIDTLCKAETDASQCALEQTCGSMFYSANDTYTNTRGCMDISDPKAWECTADQKKLSATGCGEWNYEFCFKTVTADGEATTTTNAKKGCAAAPVSGAASTDATFALAGDDTTYAIITDTWCSTNMCMDYSPRLSCLKCSATVKDIDTLCKAETDASQCALEQTCGSMFYSANDTYTNTRGCMDISDPKAWECTADQKKLSATGCVSSVETLYFLVQISGTDRIRKHSSLIG
eukprot:sb/3461600/